METTAWSLPYKAVARSNSGVTITKKIVLDCVNVFDVAVITFTSLICHLIYLGSFSDDSGDVTSYFLYGLVGALATSRILHFAKAYDFRNLGRLPWQLSRVGLAWLTVLVFGLTIAFLTKSSGDISRGWFLLWFAGALSGMVIGRIVIARLLIRWAKQGKFLRRAAIVTVESEKASLFDQLQSSDDDPIAVTGVYGVEAMDELVRDTEIDEVIVALPPAEQHRLADVVGFLSALPIDVSVAISLPIPAASFKRFEMQHNGLFGRVSERPLQHWNALHKRVLDLAVALAALLVLSPLLAVIALLIKLDSPGPVIFRQRRYGYANHSIVVYKFRTLRAEATDADAARSVTRNDNRVTRVGRFLRRSSLDELPQLFNVIKGDMSIVGPRPHAVLTKAGGRYFEDVVTNYISRHRVKPGITGWAQVNGWRGETDSEEKILRRVEHDLVYIEKWSVWLDIMIILRTIPALFERNNAY